jgi:hypothetical protein
MHRRLIKGAQRMVLTLDACLTVYTGPSPPKPIEVAPSVENADSPAGESR